MAVGIEKIKEALASLSAMVDTVGEVLEDGSIGMGDVFKLPSLIGDATSIASSLKASIESGELKDLDIAEAKDLLTDAIGLVVKIVDKFKK